MNNKDAREVLQEEINESCLRLKQAKFGHKLNDIVPDHTNNYYLPDKESYFPKEKKGVNQASSKKTLKSQPLISLKKVPQDRAMSSSLNANDHSSMFITEAYTAAMSTVKKAN
jgi:hypothetical protein